MGGVTTSMYFCFPHVLTPRTAFRFYDHTTVPVAKSLTVVSAYYIGGHGDSHKSQPYALSCFHYFSSLLKSEI